MDSRAVFYGGLGPRSQLVKLMQVDNRPTEDPKKLAGTLVSENGLEEARQIAMEMTTSANAHEDFYQLSVWRDVKRILRDWQDPAE